MRSNRTSHCLFAMVLSAILFSIGLSVQAQTPLASPSPTPAPSATPTLEKQFFKNILRDQKAIWTSPFHLRARDARWLAPLGLGTAAFIATDRSTGDEIAESRKQLNASRIVSYAGSGYGTGAVALTFYLWGRATHDDRAREILQREMPDRRVIAVDSTELIWGLGSFHCITQQEPAAN